MSQDDSPTKPNDEDSRKTVASSSSPLQMGLAGRKIGHYRLIKELGQGGQGYVYLAEDESLNRKVALKILLERARMSKEARLRFEREAEAASKLDHSGIARVYEIGEDEGLAFIAFELVQGKTLQDHISETAQRASGNPEVTEVHLDFDDDTSDTADASERNTASSSSADRDAILSAVRYTESAARALHAAHESGLIHRDIKPGNLMVRDDGTACVLDFGLAKDEESVDVTLTQSGDLMGTPAYMSPEQLLAHRLKLDRRTDIYSLGVTLFEACTLRRPFLGANRQELYEAISQEEPPSPRSINAKIPKDLSAIILTAIDKDRKRRYPSALEFAEDLRRFREFEPVQARPAGPWVKTVRWVQRNPVLAVSSVVVFLALSFAAGVFYFKGEEAKQARDNAVVAKKDAEAARDEARIARDLAKTESEEKSIALAAESKERKAKENALAEKSAALADFERLADVKKFQEASAEEKKLWPARPEKIKAIKTWLAEYEVLSQSLPGHQKSLESLRASALPHDDAGRRRDYPTEMEALDKERKALKVAEAQYDAAEGTAKEDQFADALDKVQARVDALEEKVGKQKSWRFADGVKQWKHDVLAELVMNLTGFCTTDTGTYADVQKRLLAAETIAKRTVGDHQALWDKTIAAIKKSDKYDRLVLKPQIGFIPLGEDPASGLHEFLHLETHEGPVPERDQNGKIAMTAEMGIIMVLIPKGTFWLGSQKTDPKGQNFDPESRSDEKLREVNIEEPFFLSKYEMTQGQWQRSPASLKNPSYYGVGWNYKGHKGKVGLLNPVEQVSWLMCQETLGRIGLGLPSEEQWEYAVRAGTSSVFVGGNSEISQISAWSNIAGSETKGLFETSESACRDDYLVHAPVGQFRANAFGLFDVFGNVWEWTSTASGSSDRVSRGGSFLSTAIYARVALRNIRPEGQRNNVLGLRPFFQVSSD